MNSQFHRQTSQYPSDEGTGFRVGRAGSHLKMSITHQDNDTVVNPMTFMLNTSHRVSLQRGALKPPLEMTCAMYAAFPEANVAFQPTRF